MLLALDLDHAHPAGSEARQLRLVAERRDLDPVVAADLEDRLALEAFHHPPIDLDPNPRRRLRPLWRLGVEQAAGPGLWAGRGPPGAGARGGVGVGRPAGRA